MLRRLLHDHAATLVLVVAGVACEMLVLVVVRWS